jgi:hypothetical protein
VRDRTFLLAFLVIIVAMLLAACGDGDAGTTSTVGPTTTAPPTTTSSLVGTTTTNPPTTTTTAGPTTTTGPEIDVTVEGGQVSGEERFSFTVGERVSVWLLSDVDEEAHVHGYDVSFPVTAGVPVEISLIADVPGIFEVELEGSGLPLFELEVTP